MEPVKDEEREHPVPTAWRPRLKQLADLVAAGDVGRAAELPGVGLDQDTIEQMQSYIEDYGATLAALPEQTWDTSVAQWSDPHWDVLVDLWTEEEGLSDLVLHLNVYEDGRIVVHLVYVP